MSTHPNAILMAVLEPDNLSRKTMRDILADNVVKYDNDVVIGNEEYHSIIMESDYHNGFQIAADEGNLVFFDMVTYGYGDAITWDTLEKQKETLEAWAVETCRKHNCTYTIRITANYW